MFEEIELEEFLKQYTLSENVVSIGITLLLPDRQIDAKPIEGIKEELLVHDHLFNEVLCSSFEVEHSLDQKDKNYKEDLDTLIKSVIKGKDMRFINISYYVIEPPHFIAVVQIPSVINLFQFNGLRKLKELYKKIGIFVTVQIHNFNPITMSSTGEEDICFGEDGTSKEALADALNYIIDNKKIQDYQISDLNNLNPCSKIV